MGKILNKAEELLNFISRIALFIMMVLISVDTGARYFFNRPFQGVLEITELYLMGTIIFFSISYITREDGHIRVDLIARHFREPLRRKLEVVFKILTLSFFLLITIETSDVAFRSFFEKEEILGHIPWPVYVSWLIVSVGIFVMCLRLLFDLIKNLISIKN